MTDGENGKSSMPQNEGEELDNRREALKRMGKYAAYTAPALIAVLTVGKAEFAVAACSGPPGGCVGEPPPGGTGGTPPGG